MEKLSGSRWQHQEEETSSSDDGRTEYPSTSRNGYSSSAPNKTAGTTFTNLPRTHAELGSQAPAVTYENGEHANSGDGGRLADRSSTTELEVMCGPLLNYTGMSNMGSTTPTWHGSVLMVTTSGQHQPEIRLGLLEDVVEARDHDSGTSNGPYSLNGNVSANYDRGYSPSNSEQRRFPGLQLYADTGKTFWRFTVELPVLAHEARWQYTISIVRIVSNTGPQPKESLSTFVVPAATQSMRMMFHSCNGFSVGTDEEAWSGPALWNDVLRMHKEKPFHVMIGGGDQIYNDGVRVGGPLHAWTDISNPKRRRNYPFGEKLREQCDDYYLTNYIKWYSTESFASANRQIAQINIWDDHDIIDGFGSYTDHFMRCAVFRGIGGIAFKYYCLFQHHIPPPTSTFTTDAPQTTHSQGPNGAGADPVQLKDAFILEESNPEPHFILGRRPGPYIQERSRSVYMRLGARIAFLGIDARTERTRHQINYPETYDLIFQRAARELGAASGAINHLILLLGVPIAYPRLAWLERLFSSPLITPLKILNKRFGFAGAFFNHFDGKVDLLDDLDDHYSARLHKAERKALVLRLQDLSHEFGVRVTILGGDVHLAACGRFYSNPKLQVPVERDHRFIVNVISSAITNHPPPEAVANLLARRNKIHHLDARTDETLMKLFDRDPGAGSHASRNNRVTMPSRNYAVLAETEGAKEDGDQAGGYAGFAEEGRGAEGLRKRRTDKNAGHTPLHVGEEGAGTTHVAAGGGGGGGGRRGDLEVCFRVEVERTDRGGGTEGYGFSVPVLVGVVGEEAC